MGRKARSINAVTKRDMARRSLGLRQGVAVARITAAVSEAGVIGAARVTVTVAPGEVGDTGLARVTVVVDPVWARDRVTGHLPVTAPGAVLPPNGCFVTQTNSI